MLFLILLQLVAFPLDSMAHTSQSVLTLGAVNRVITPELSNLVEELRVKFSVPGLTLAVAFKDGTSEAGAWGKKSESGEAMTTDTLFHLASCSKAVTATAMGILMEDFATGKNKTNLPEGVRTFDWHTKAKDLLPSEWELMDEWATEKVNIHDMLSHTTGVARHDFSYGPGDTPEELLRRIKYLTPAFELRQKYHYNNQMYMIASYIVSKYSAEGFFPSFVQERIFKPLGMSASTYSPESAAASGKLTQSWHIGRRIPQYHREPEIALNAGPGGIITNVEDMVPWIHVLLNKGQDASGEAIIPEAVIEDTMLGYTISNGKSKTPSTSISSYGMGWDRFAYRGHEVIDHDGGIPGFASRVMLWPADGFGVVVLINDWSSSGILDRIQHHIAEQLIGMEPLEAQKPKPKPEGEESTTLEVKKLDNMGSTPLPQTLAGTYTNPGYGTFTICHPSGTSDQCLKTHADFEPFEDVHTFSDRLYASFPRLWSSHIRFMPRKTGDNTRSFDLVYTTLFPKGYGDDTSPFEVTRGQSGAPLVEFVVNPQVDAVIGFGLFETTGEVTERQRLYPNGTVEERADVWFTKVS